MLDGLAGKGWLLPSLLAILFWGVWGFLTKVIGSRIPWPMMLVYMSVGTLGVAILGRPWRPEMNLYHLAGLASGLSCAMGYYFFYRAIPQGHASVVVPFTALYIALVAVLAFCLLAEPVRPDRIMGLLCAVAAIYLLAR